MLYHVKRLAENDKSMVHKAATAAAKAAALVNLAQATSGFSPMSPRDVLTVATAPPQTKVKARGTPSDSSSKALAAILAGQEARASAAAAWPGGVAGRAVGTLLAPANKSAVSSSTTLST